MTGIWKYLKKTDIYISELEKQNLNEIDWSDFALNKAILCINGIPIINEDNFPYECILFIPKSLNYKEKQEIINNKKETQFVIFSGKNWDQNKKRDEYLSFLKNFKRKYKNKIFNSKSLSQPIFFGEKYILISSYSLLKLSTCLFKNVANGFRNLDCEVISYK